METQEATSTTTLPDESVLRHPRVRVAGAFVDYVAKFLLPATAVLYAVGFLVTTIHHARLHIQNVSLFKPQYILAGIWPLLPSVIIIGALVPLYSRIPQPRTRWQRLRQSTLWFILVAIGFGLGTCTLMTAATILGADLNLWHEFCQARVIGFVFGAALIFIGAHKHTRDLSNAVQSILARPSLQVPVRYITALRKPFDVADGAVAALGLVGRILGYLGIFSLIIHPLIPQSIGGGRPESVVFILRQDSSVRVPILEPGATPPYSREYALLFESDQTYYILAPGDRRQLVQFPKDVVTGHIITLASEVFLQPKPNAATHPAIVYVPLQTPPKSHVSTQPAPSAATPTTSPAPSP